MWKRSEDQCTECWEDVEVPDGVLRMLQKISDLRATLGGGKDQGILDPAFENGVYVSALAQHFIKGLTHPPLKPVFKFYSLQNTLLSLWPHQKALPPKLPQDVLHVRAASSG